nr:histidine kinase [Ornithinimicrobium sp. F0845]
MAAVAVGISAPLALASETGEILQGVAGLLLPIGIGTAVLREELWDLDLRRRYDKLRLARDQERERLRRELHDSLGPVLGSISMRAEAARNVLATGDAARADDLLASIGTATEGALTEVRRLIDNLGPTALADRDLAPALHTQLAAYSESFP